MSDLVEKLPLIPLIMKRRGWNTASALMQRWFDGPPSNQRNNQPPNTSDVKMDWVLSFPRAALVYKQLVNDRVWTNLAARNEISHQLHSRGTILTGPVPFGDLITSVVKLDKSYINARSVVSSITDPLDDLFGALGSFTFRVAVQGVMAPLATRSFEIAIEKVYVYVHDSYDFEDDHWYSQPLGFWSFDGSGDVSKFPGLHSYAVYNSSFQEYRAAKKHGGDFWVYSDVKVLNVWPPDKFRSTL